MAGFEILPAIDLEGGRVVRLVQGDFTRETVYEAEPVGVARAFADAGATWDLFIFWQPGEIAGPLRTLLNELNLKSQ